ncbi:hypothetical protein [Paenibacillus sp. J2TS4]|uniref:hypothetical protein n=1 Tax=Paenibacillus sp. J2TS4 TaxID=2807194 RepID=UPI001AFF9107|nr:hypothetical protein [Paenibacillus sp. J2TS4]GIP35757.1 hypothetical protein J2TS4_49670 [Paenibacillus sp. J2TS4]
MKKLKKPGENISLKTKKSESPAIMDWINSQTNLMDSIRYLIENEVRENGVRNLQNYIPAERALGVLPVSPASRVPEGIDLVSTEQETAATAEAIGPADVENSPAHVEAVSAEGASSASETTSGESLSGKIGEAGQASGETGADTVEASAAVSATEEAATEAEELEEVVDDPIEDDIDEEDIESWL